LRCLEENQKNIDEFYNQEEELIDSTFENIQSTLATLKEGMKNEITIMRLKQIEKFKAPENNQKQADLKKIEDDINENMDNIIKHIDNEPFRIIINKYKEKITTIES